MGHQNNDKKFDLDVDLFLNLGSPERQCVLYYMLRVRRYETSKPAAAASSTISSCPYDGNGVDRSYNTCGDRNAFWGTQTYLHHLVRSHYFPYTENESVFECACVQNHKTSDKAMEVLISIIRHWYLYLFMFEGFWGDVCNIVWWSWYIGEGGRGADEGRMGFSCQGAAAASHTCTNLHICVHNTQSYTQEFLNCGSGYGATYPMDYSVFCC